MKVVNKVNQATLWATFITKTSLTSQTSTIDIVLKDNFQKVIFWKLTKQ